jgi:hypothetical protein
MKNTIISAALAAISLTACDSGNNKSDESTTTSSAGTLTEQPANNPEAERTTPINEVVHNYLQLKNALADDNGQEAANAGSELVDAMKKLDRSALPPEQLKVYEDVEEDATEHAEHIGMNADKIEHQREHFDMLSKDMYDLVKTFNQGQTLYLDYCPMYNDNKGAIWLSETKEIKNPYLGNSMPSCGEVKEEIN